MQVAQYSQRDPRWAGDELGTSGLTLGQAGCLVCAVASALTDFGVRMTPAELNRRLLQVRGYVNGGLLVWSSLRHVGAECIGYLNCAREPAPMGALLAALNTGHAIIVRVDAQPGKAGVQDHWVRVLQPSGADCLVMDPWRLPGQELGSLLRWYGLPNWDAARTILSVATLAPLGGLRGLSATHRARLRGLAQYGAAAPLPGAREPEEGR